MGEAADGGGLFGSLNVYGRGHAAFDRHTEYSIRLIATASATAITTARRSQRARREVAQLEIALESRSEIEQAKGVLMTVHACTAEEAFARLVDRSQRTSTKLLDVARSLLASLRD